jgi:hypothetical protein
MLMCTLFISKLGADMMQNKEKQKKLNCTLGILLIPFVGLRIYIKSKAFSAYVIPLIVIEIPLCVQK